GESGVDELGGKLVGCLFASLDDGHWEADLLGVGHAFLDAPEGTAVEQVRRVHRVAGLPQLIGEGVEARPLTLRVVEEQDLGHLAPLSGASDTTRAEREPSARGQGVVHRATPGGPTHRGAPGPYTRSLWT